VAIALALMSALLGGTADFLGGNVSKRLRAVAVIGLTQLASAMALVAIAAVGRHFILDWSVVALGCGAGVTMLIGLASFYSALASGTMGVVAPIAALGVIVPLTWGLALGETPQSLQVVGILVALAGVFLSSGPELRGVAGVRPLLLACAAAVGFGSSMIFVAEGADTSPVMTLLVMKGFTVCLAIPFIRRQELSGLGAGVLFTLTVIAVTDIGANLCFAYATTRGMVSIVAVLGSLYPVATVLWARWLLGERIALVQQIGVGVALSGVILISAGGA
jgi:drug/metabolite transporter (DMT)-like permease